MPPTPPTSEPEDDTPALLHHYLNLNPSLSSLYASWSLADPNFALRASYFAGVRILAQDSWEALVCFICSSNNNIARITRLVHTLCHTWGPYIGHLPGSEKGGERDSAVPFHDFPSPAALSGPDTEARLRERGFGYRARYIAETARIVAAEGPDWLDQLRNPAAPMWPWPTMSAVRGFTPAPPDTAPSSPPVPTADADADAASAPATYKSAHMALLALPGVGPKVADCVCLMGLGWGEAVPVDTHVWQIAQRDYKFRARGGSGGGGKTTTLTRATYDAVGDHFRALWGDQAGWAHSVLFTADLKTFAGRGKEEKEEGEGSNRVKAEERGAGKLPVELKERKVLEEESDDRRQRSTKRRRVTVSTNKTVKVEEVRVGGKRKAASVTVAIATTTTSKRRRAKR